MGQAWLECIEPTCAATFDVTEKLYACPKCAGLLDVTYDFSQLDPTELKRLWRERSASLDLLDISGVWRFRELIPFTSDYADVVTLREGNTPLYSAPRSADYAGMRRLTFKHQGLNPTGSFKDNGMTTAVTQARRLRARVVACASTGNTSASMAAYAAQAGLQAAVFIPSGPGVAFGKLSQSLEYGAATLQIDGDFDVALRLVIELASETDLYLLNSINPFRLEGQKVIAVELLAQRDWRVPDRIVLPGGNLGNAAALGKGLKELFDYGFIPRMPRLTVVQAHGANPFFQLMDTGSPELVPMTAHTLATAVKIGSPVSWKKARRALAWTDGDCVEVSEEEIADAKAVIGRDGIGCEPASATTLAGIKKMVAAQSIDPAEDIVAILTGNLLKDPGYTIDYHLNLLYQEKVTRTETARAVGHIIGKFANPPISTPVDKAAIKNLLGL